MVPLDMLLQLPGGRGVRPSGVPTNRRLTGFWTGWRSPDIHGFPGEALIASMGSRARPRACVRARASDERQWAKGGESQRRRGEVPTPMVVFPIAQNGRDLGQGSDDECGSRRRRTTVAAGEEEL